MREIVIDLTQRNDVKEYKDSNLFQHEALTQCDQMLSDTITNIDYKNSDKISECRTHNTIFISGGRGSGKTVFLINMKNSELLKSRSELQFISPIDPTLLHDGCEIASCESFIAVILGRIDQEVSAVIDDIEAKNRGNSIRNDYSKRLKDVAEALADMKDSSNESGFDAIYGKASALKLEQNIHEYLRFICDNIFRKKIILLPIDDIDMAFTHGFKVLEVVRRYLASPYVLTVITGDYELYQNIVEKKFKSEISVYDDERDKNKEETKKLAEKYLLKILPADRRIRLQTVEEIFRQNNISVILDKSNSSEPIKYKKIEKFEDVFFNNWVCRKEYKNDLLNIMDSVRKQIMFLEKMKPWYLANETQIKNISDDSFFSNISDPSNFLEYKAMQNRLQSFFGDATNDTDTRITYIQDNLSAIIEPPSSSGPVYYSHQVLLDKINKILTADPRESNINSDFPRREGAQFLYIAKRVDENKQYDFPETMITTFNNETKLVAALFGFDNYYLQSHRVPILLIAGRFVEYIFTTFNIPNCSKKNTSDCEQVLYSNLNATPLFVGRVAEKIYLDSPAFEIDETDEDESSNLNTTAKEDVSSYPYGLSIVNIKNIFDIFSTAEFTSFSPKYFIDANFMNQVLDRFYNNLSLYIGDKSLKTDNLLEYAQRVAIMLLNAIAACEKTDLEKVSFQNIALSKTIGKKELEQSDSYRINIKPFFTPISIPTLTEESTKEQKDAHEKIVILENRRKSSITYRIANHFLMRIILGDIVCENLSEKQIKAITLIHKQLSAIYVRRGTVEDGSMAPLTIYRNALSNSKVVGTFINNLRNYKKKKPAAYLEDIQKNLKWTTNIDKFYDQANEAQKKIIVELTGYKG